MLEGGNIQVTGYWGEYLFSVRQDGREGSVTGGQYISTGKNNSMNQRVLLVQSL